MRSFAGITPEAAFDFLVFIVGLILLLTLLYWTFRVGRGWLIRAALLVPERRALEGHMRQLGYLSLLCAGAATVWAWIDPDGPLVRVLSRPGIFWFSVAMVPYWMVLERAARRVGREIA